jgi:hypothetical protein
MGLIEIEFLRISLNAYNLVSGYSPILGVQAA